MQVSEFSKKMMAKMGHQDGQGLGNDGSGIHAPIDPTSRSHEAEVATDPAMQISEFSKKMMAKMGHQDGQGLGNDGSGIHALIDPTSRSHEAEVATDPAMQVSEFSKKMMAKMGHQDGQGLGMDGSGIHAPIDPISRSQGARAGLGFGGSESILQDQDRIRRVDPSDIIWLDLDAVKHLQVGKTFDGFCQINWVETGAKLKEIQMSKFCQDKIILSLLQVRTGEAKTQAARHYFGCHGVEKIGFVSRSALKLADLQSIVTLALQDKAPDLTGLFKGDEQDLSFIDLYGGQGGFSDYMLWKYNSCGKSIHRWWMLNRQGKKRPNIAGFKAFCSEDTPFSYNPAHSDIVDASNMEAMKAFLDATGATTNPVGMVFGDGTVDNDTIKKLEPEHRPRTIELLSMSTLWCQVWSALGVLRTGGSFICKVTDSFSRCAIGTYYLMCHCFRLVTFIKPSMSCPSKCERFLVALDFLGQDNETVQSVRAHLAHVLSVAASLPEDKDVVQIIPMAIILQEPFLNRMTKLNERHARSVTSAMEDLQKASVSNTNRMHVDSQLELIRMGLAGPLGPRNQVRVDLQDSTSKTPLHVAASIGYEWGVKSLLDVNAEPTIKDKMNRSVVEYAEQKGKLSCVQAIHEAVISIQTQSDEEAQTAASPLEKAVKQATDEDDAQQVSQKGMLSCVQAITSIHEAVTSLQTQSDAVAQTAALPLEKAVKQAIDEDDAQQLYELLQQHAKMGQIELIIDNLYDGFKGRSCLHRACAGGKINCCRKLLELGASPNVMSWQESSNEVQMGPLHLVLQFAPDPYRQECVSAFLKHKLVNVDLQDSTGKTPLHVAAGIGYEWGVKALLDANADPSIKDIMNRSVVDYAEQKGQRSCVQAIREAKTQRDEEAQAAASPFAPFLQDGDRTSPEGLTQVVYHQVQWLLYRGFIPESNIFQDDTVMGYLRSSDTCQLLSKLKDYEEGCRSKDFEPSKQALLKELAQGRNLNVFTPHPTNNGLIAERTTAAGATEKNTQKFGDAEIIEQLNSFYSKFNLAKVGQAEKIWKLFQSQSKEHALANLNKALADMYLYDLNTCKAQSEMANPEPKISDGKEEASKYLEEVQTVDHDEVPAVQEPAQEQYCAACANAIKKLQDELEQLKHLASGGGSSRSEQPVLPTSGASSAQQQPQRAIAGANDVATTGASGAQPPKAFASTVAATASSSSALPSLADIFKAKPGEWHCSACMTRNPSSAKVQCLSCELPKPGTGAAAGGLGGFGAAHASTGAAAGGFGFGAAPASIGAAAGGFGFGTGGAAPTSTGAAAGGLGAFGAEPVSTGAAGGGFGFGGFGRGGFVAAPAGNGATAGFGSTANSYSNTSFGGGNNRRFICKNWTGTPGSCKYGAKCGFQHSTPAVGAFGAATNTSGAFGGGASGGGFGGSASGGGFGGTTSGFGVGVGASGGVSFGGAAVGGFGSNISGFGGGPLGGVLQSGVTKALSLSHGGGLSGFTLGGPLAATSSLSVIAEATPLPDDDDDDDAFDVEGVLGGLDDVSIEKLPSSAQKLAAPSTSFLGGPSGGLAGALGGPSTPSQAPTPAAASAGGAALALAAPAAAAASLAPAFGGAGATPAPAFGASSAGFTAISFGTGITGGGFGGFGAAPGAGGGFGSLAATFDASAATFDASAGATAIAAAPTTAAAAAGGWGGFGTDASPAASAAAGGGGGSFGGTGFGGFGTPVAVFGSGASGPTGAAFGFGGYKTQGAAPASTGAAAGGFGFGTGGAAPTSTGAAAGGLGGFGAAHASTGAAAGGFGFGAAPASTGAAAVKRTSPCIRNGEKLSSAYLIAGGFPTSFGKATGTGFASFGATAAAPFGGAAVPATQGAVGPAERNIADKNLLGASPDTIGNGNCNICREERCRNQAKCHMIERLIDAVTSGAEKTTILEICKEAGRKGVETLVNELCKRDVEEGRTALAYAVQMNDDRVARDLIEHGASVHQRMGTNTTALTLAATNERMDGTEMVRLLLSKRADPSELEQAGIEIEKLNITMQYWLQISRKSPKLSYQDLQHLARAPPMHKMYELGYAIVGERLSLAMFKSALSGWFSKPRGFTTSGKLERDPLVMLLLGCPGHGKTYISRNTAAALVGQDNYKEVACGSIRDDANLFGSKLGGYRKDSYSSKGELIEWLRKRQGRDVIVFLDEFEKMLGLKSSLGHGQDEKIYKSFLEPWQEGWLSDTSSESGPKVDCSRVVWILTSNWGQDKIIQFAEKPENGWLYEKVDEDDWGEIKRDLIDKVLVPEVMATFKDVGKDHADLQALARRINWTIPFLPFTKDERRVVADLEIRNKFQQWRSPAVLTDREEKLHKNKLYGNLQLIHTCDFLNHAASQYVPMEGASSVSRVVEQVDGVFTLRMSENRFQLSEDERKVIRSDRPRPTGCSEPKFWVDYDEDDTIIRILQSAPESRS